MQTNIKQIDQIEQQDFNANEAASKDELLLLATRRFCDTDVQDRLSVEQYKEAFYLLIGTSSFQTKKLVSERLSDHSFTPRSIALFFALEPVEVSSPVLINSTVLGQLDLLQIIEMKGSGHAQLIATRPDIGPSVVKRLKEFEIEEIDLCLSQNAALVNDAADRGADALFERIIGKPIESSSQQQTQQQPTVASAETQLTSAEQKLIQAASRGGRIEPPLASPPASQPFDFGLAMEKSARARSTQGMAVLVQKKLGLAFETVQQVLADKTGDTLSVLLKAAEVDRAQANRILLLTFPTIGLSTQNAMRAIRFYETLKVDSCQDAVEQWPKADTDIDAVHQPVLEDGKTSFSSKDPRETRQYVPNTQTRSAAPDLASTG